MHILSSCKVPIILVSSERNLNCFSRFLKNIENPVFPCGQTDIPKLKVAIAILWTRVTNTNFYSSMYPTASTYTPCLISLLFWSVPVKQTAAVEFWAHHSNSAANWHLYQVTTFILSNSRHKKFHPFQIFLARSYTYEVLPVFILVSWSTWTVNDFGDCSTAEHLFSNFHHTLLEEMG
jgi:hypothetical protein